MEIMVGGVWLDEVGPYGDITYSENWLHGCESASWQMRPRTRHPALRPGVTVTIFDGPWPLWSGVHAETGRDGSMDAAGAWLAGAGVLAIDGGGTPTANPETATAAAVTRGAVRWVKPVQSFISAAVGDADATLMLNALLDRYSEATGYQWRVNHLGVVEHLPAPTEPAWGVLLDTEELWSRASEDYVSHLNVYYMSGVGTYAAFVWTTAESAAAAELWGREEAFLDLSGLGIITLGTAQSYATQKLAETGPRMALAEPLVLGRGQLRTMGDTAAGWSGVHAGQMVRLWGVPDRSRTVPTLHTDMTIGRVERSASTLTLAPQGLPPRNTRDVIAALSA